MILPPTPKTVNDFKVLFNLVCTKHQGPVIADFGRQMYWEGIVAAEYTPHIQSIQADGINAIYDDRHGHLQFTQGSPALLRELLASTQNKPSANKTAAHDGTATDNMANVRQTAREIALPLL